MNTASPQVAYLQYLLSWLACAALGIVTTSARAADAPPVANSPSASVWYTTGPLPASGLNEALFPETGVDLKATSSDGKPLWTAKPKWRDGSTQGLSTLDDSTTYLFRTIQCRDAAKLPVGFGSEGGIEVWLGGKKILSNKGPHAMVPNQFKTTLDLQPGSNDLLVKVYCHTGGCRLFFSGLASPSHALNSPPNALRLSIRELQSKFGSKYPSAKSFLEQLSTLETEYATLDTDANKTAAWQARFDALQRQALVTANPCIDFNEILAVRRERKNLGLPQNWQGNSSIKPRIDNELVRFEVKGNAAPTTVYKPAEPWFVGDINLHFNADRLLFSSIGNNNCWQVFELKIGDATPTIVTPDKDPDIDNYNGIYLPDGRILFDSTSSFVGVPCVGGKDSVANLHLLSADRKSVRRLCFEQDNDWYPTLMPDGRVLFLRWEYTDSAHYFSRVLMSMNPDGTNQIEYYGSNSYWPNSTFYAKPLPGQTGKFVGIVSGHHGAPRMGEMVLFDLTSGRQENSGAVQTIPGYGKPVEDKIQDQLAGDFWPKSLHPLPIADKYFLVASQPRSNANWGIYLVDVFDNRVLLREEPGYAFLEPIPLRKTPAPPVIPDKVNLAEKTATVSIQDIYTGRGLPGVPRGTVKSLRVYQYEYSYRNMGGHYCIGMEGPWDVRRLLGTVPVQPDGSSYFEIPANTPVSLQPLDAEGKALQLKRSWMVGMPGEHVSCVGCHDEQNSGGTAPKLTQAAQLPVAKLQPWHGPTRGFSFIREVQPVLDKYCVGCHDDKHPERPRFDDASGHFPKSYNALHPYVRRNGPEGDYQTLMPLEFHADTSDLIQILQKGHYNVKLDAEAWDRLITWIDLNVPALGTWSEVGRIPKDFEQRRHDMLNQYAAIDEDIEAIPNPYVKTEKFIQPAPMPPKPPMPAVAKWPFSADQAAQMQKSLGATETKLDLGDGLMLELKRIPAGEFAMGDTDGYPDEYPVSKVAIRKPFWMATTEISLEQYQQFNAQHANGYYDMHYKDQVKPGYLMDFPELPVIRVTWNEAMDFCRWLSQRSGKNVTLPTEAQWEWAARAGSTTPLWYGDLDTDFSQLANLGDVSLKKLAVSGVDPQPIKKPGKDVDFVPKDTRFNDGVLHLAPCGHYQANPWGLKDMAGNVAEWTRSTYLPYPYQAAADAPTPKPAAKKSVRGGSWYDRPVHARSGFRQAYPAWQKVSNVGFRVIVED
ncbi:MAG: SUMF1/EgtB/PvdO family nonheme iron enzyme [Verrucomicrobiota bacterium]